MQMSQNITSLQGKNALITGVSRKIGIGAALARLLAQSGVNIFTTYYRSYDQSVPGWEKNATEAEAIIAELQASNVKADGIELDLTDVRAPEILFDRAEAAVGSIDILINNACYSVDVGIEELTPEILDKHYKVNFRATALLCAEFVKRFKARTTGEFGKIINFTSGYPLEPNPGNLAYSATKSAVNRFTTSASLEVAPYKITINAIDPGPTDTGWMSPDLKKQLRSAAPFGRLGFPEDAALLVKFLASQESNWITGQILHSRGGF